MATQTATEKTTRVIFRCHWCQKAGRLGAIRRIEYSGTHQLYRPDTSATPKRWERTLYTFDDERCPTCKHYCEHNTVEGKVNVRIRCNDVCRGAVGCRCSCSCGGKNHGKDYDFD